MLPPPGEVLNLPSQLLGVSLGLQVNPALLIMASHSSGFLCFVLLSSFLLLFSHSPHIEFLFGCVRLLCPLKIGPNTFLLNPHLHFFSNIPGGTLISPGGSPAGDAVVKKSRHQEMMVITIIIRDDDLCTHFVQALPPIMPVGTAQDLTPPHLGPGGPLCACSPSPRSSCFPISITDVMLHFFLENSILTVTKLIIFIPSVRCRALPS